MPNTLNQIIFPPEMSNSSTTPNKHDANCLAVFIEAVEELKREPFFSPDDQSKISMQGSLKQATFGDRSHFRSALITFRRMWLEKEASCFPAICKLIKRYEGGVAQNYIDGVVLVHYNAYIKASFMGIKLSGQEVVDLWLNGVFAHTNIKRGEGWVTRIKFHETVKKYGATSLEFQCRNVVKSVGYCYFNLLATAKRTLKRWETDYEITPDFEIGAPFGKTQVESNEDGFIVTRKASTEHSPNETEQQKTDRFLNRSEFSTLKKVVAALRLDESVFFESFKAAKTYQEFLKKVGYEVIVNETANAQEFVSQMGEGGVNAIIPDHYYSIQSNLLTIVHSNRTVITTSFSIQHFDQQLTDLKFRILS
jgi:hypothetical protein